MDSKIGALQSGQQICARGRAQSNGKLPRSEECGRNVHIWKCPEVRFVLVELSIGNYRFPSKSQFKRDPAF